MTYVKTYLSTLKTHAVNLKRDAKDLSLDLQRLEVRVREKPEKNSGLQRVLFACQGFKPR